MYRMNLLAVDSNWIAEDDDDEVAVDVEVLDMAVPLELHTAWILVRKHLAGA